jgi:hypothetical protein
MGLKQIALSIQKEAVAITRRGVPYGLLPSHLLTQDT